MKFFAIITVMLLVAACQPHGAMDRSTHEDHMEEMDHIGCQEQEIDEDGNCVPADSNNVELFGQDLSSVVVSEEIEGEVSGFLAQPIEPGNYPGIIMIHEWWGLNDNVKEMAELLANEGYVVFAVDLYDGNVAEDSTKARELVTAVRENPDAAVETMKLATNYLKELGVTKIGSMGWCFGGQQSLQISLNDQVDATVIYYGHLNDDPEALQSINGPVLGIFGEEDQSITVDSVNSFKEALDNLDIENDITIYPGVGHAFANPSGNNYAPDETVDAWEKTVDFLNTNLKE